MNEEFYSIGRGSLNINGKFYYGLDYQITDFMRSLEEENKQLKEKLQQKEDIIDKIEDYLIKNNLFSYKYDEEELYEIVTDDKARTDLLKILDNKGE